MGKIISFELKKYMSHIGTYILMLFMAILLVATSFMYKPDIRTSASLTLPGETISEMYSNFTTNGIKSSYDTIVENLGANASSYVTEDELYNTYNNPNTISNLFTTFDDKCILYVNTVNGTMAEYNILLNGIETSFTNLTNALDSGFQYSEDGTGYYMLITQSNYDKLYYIINQININFNSPSDHQNAGENYYNNLRPQLKDALNTIVYPNLNDVANKYSLGGGYYTIVKSRLNEISIKIDKEYQKVIEDSSLEKNKDIVNNINTLFNRYAYVVDVYKTALNADICVEALSNFKSNAERQNVVGYSHIAIYNQAEIVTEYEYYLTHHSNPEDYANSFSVTHTSNFKENAYDYTYFVLSIFAILITIFALYMAANTISGEINKGTMRLTAVRPIKRGSMFFGKYLSIIIISAIMLVATALLAFGTGAYMFGIETADMLMIIDGSSIFVAHPAIMLGIFMLSILLQVIVYSAIAMLLSSFIKSDLFVMIISVLFYGVNLLLPIFFGASSWLRFNPFTNINLFAYFGANRLTNDSILAKLFNNIVYNGMNLWISALYIIVITSVVLLIAKTIFKRRDL